MSMPGVPIGADLPSISDARRARSPGEHPVREMLRQARASLSLEKFQQIEGLLRQAMGFAPRSGECLHLVGRVHHQLDNNIVALRTLQEAVTGGRQTPAIFNDMGNVLMALAQYDAAASAYGVAIRLFPTLPQLYENQVRALMRAGRRDAAEAALRQALDHCPGDPVVGHMLAAVSGRNVAERASNEYVRQVFDRFADEFDRKLASLRYSAPEHVAATALEVLAGGMARRILDAGCGTGLCGPKLRPLGERLEGVDLSPRMLARAQARGCYDNLTADEIGAFLALHPRSFDLIVAADVFCYFGDLSSLFCRLAGALQPDGHLIFTLEALREDGVELLPSGRYAHGRAHVAAAAATAGLRVERLESIVLRHEFGAPVEGYLALLTADRVSGRLGGSR
ncbi:MAG: methyltransferase domain-containing protein [Alphaproteobacteria bacterium]|nr:methyltransferase domain-containing protein [Alphaproteobacteria bacterium]